MKFEKLNLDKFKAKELKGYQAKKVCGGLEEPTYEVSFDINSGEPSDSNLAEDGPRRSSRVKLA
ncbi:MAG: hypothetical protein AAFP77_05460 [Bacteroidota bacterium]